MPRIVYSLCLYFATPFILLRLLLRSVTSPKYRQRISERFAWTFPETTCQESQALVWVHAVSVGEVAAAAPLVKVLLAQGHRILLTTTTPTGSDRVNSTFGEEVSHCYLPYDLPGAVNRFLNSVSPTLLLIMETELWPNLIHYCHVQKIPTVLINGRLSAKSAKGYARFSVLSKPMLESLSYIAAQSDTDEKRLLELGVRESSISVTGSLKFNITIVDEDEKEDVFFDSVSSSQRPVVIAASTREGEEAKVLKAFSQIIERFPTTLLLIVPRHPERFTSVAKLCEQNKFNILRRSATTAVNDSVNILIGDSMGEMVAYYRLADIAFVGGSLVDTGCQNVLEPAALAIPILVGPSQYNFAAICELLEEAGGLVTISNEQALADSVCEWLEHPKKGQATGLKGFDVIQNNQNALPKVLKILERYLPKDANSSESD